MTPHVVAIVLSWNGREDTLACLASLAAATYPRLSTVVVDNGSVDGVAEAVAEQYPSVTVVRLERNHGFTGGVNAGIDAARRVEADAVLPLNNDMTVEPGFLEPLVDALARDDRAGAACAQILYADPPDRIWYAGAPYRPGRGHFGRNTHYGEPPLDAATTPYGTACACFGCVLVPVTVIDEIGALDDGLFAYREDLDWSLRLAAHGRHVLVAPAGLVRHRVSSASGGEASPTTLYYDTRNLMTVTERHDPRGTLGSLRRRVEIVAAHLVQALTSAQRRRGIHAVLRGWRDARRGVSGPEPAS